MKEMISTLIVSAILILCVVFVFIKMRKSKGCHGSCGGCEKDCGSNMKEFINNYKNSKGKV